MGGAARRRATDRAGADGGGRLTFEVLGPLAVRADGVDVTPGSGRQRLLLALLLIHRGRPVPAERLIAEIWGDAPPNTVTAALQVHVSALRKFLGERLRWASGGYLLDVDAAAVDAGRFEALLAAARPATPGDPPDLTRLREAEALWHGEPYAGAGTCPGLADERHRLGELRLTTVITRIEAELALGHHERLVPELTGLVGAHPARERLVSALMLALYRSGRSGDAQAAYDRAVTVLERELGVPASPELTALARAIERQDPTLDLALPSVPIPATRFVGRRDELDRLARALGDSRLLTLTGPGGVGKTRLAVQLCRETVADHPDGVTWVELAAVTDPAGVLPRLADGLGVRETYGIPLAESVVARLRTGRQLLVLDNCEHLRAACADLVTTLLAGCPAVRVLATSREPLQVAGETRWPVAGLRVGPDAAASDAVRLLGVRARAVRPDFRLDAATTAAAARLCARLDGLPLAIEMVAARLRSMSVPEAERRVGRHLDLAAGHAAAPRHRTLRSAVDWGYDLLSDSERVVFRRLAVFSGGFSLEAAERVAADPGGEPPTAAEAVADVLVTLVDRSFTAPVFGAPGADTRYTMLRTLHAYAEERLADSADEAAARRRHAEWCRDFAARSAEFGGALHGAHLAALRAEQDNMRRALEWSLGPAGDPALALEIASSLWWFWWLTGQLTEGRRWLAGALDATGDQPPQRRVHALRAAASLARSAHDLDAALRWGEAALTAARQLGDPAGVARALNGLCMTANARHDLAASLRFGEESRRYAEAAGDPRGVAAAANNVGVTLRCLGRVDESADLFTEARERFAALADRRGEAAALYNLAVVARRRGRLDASRELCLRSLALYHELELAEGEADVAEALACLEVAEGRPERALRLLHAAAHRRRELGAPVFTPDEIADRDAAFAAARAAVTDPATGAEATDLAGLLAELLPSSSTSTIPTTASCG